MPQIDEMSYIFLCIRSHFKSIRRTILTYPHHKVCPFKSLALVIWYFIQNLFILFNPFINHIMINQKDGIISTRGLKEDAVLYGELVFDVNTAYFHNHGGYVFAKQFYADAYKAAIKIMGGEQYILSAVMHADERNRAMSDALEQDVYHYHLHVVYVPVVEKQILWSKRCRAASEAAKNE